MAGYVIRELYGRFQRTEEESSNDIQNEFGLQKWDLNDRDELRNPSRDVLSPYVSSEHFSGSLLSLLLVAWISTLQAGLMILALAESSTSLCLKVCLL